MKDRIQNEKAFLSKNSCQFYDKGIYLLNQKKHEEALNYFDLSLKNNPDNEFAARGKLRALIFISNRHAELVETATLVINLSPFDLTAWAYKAESLSELNQCENALKAVDFALKLCTTGKANLYGVKGKILLQFAYQIKDKEKITASVEYLKKANQDNRHIQRLLADGLFGTADFKSANKLFEKLIDEKPSDRLLVVNAYTLFRLQRYSESLKEFDKVQDHKTFSYHILRGKWHNLHRLGKHEEALKHYNSSLEHKPVEDPRRHPWAYLGTDEGIYKEALQSVEESLKLNSTHQHLHFEKGCTLIKLKQYMEALSELKQALALPSSPAFEEMKEYCESQVNELKEIISPVFPEIKHRDLSKDEKIIHPEVTHILSKFPELTEIHKRIEKYSDSPIADWLKHFCIPLSMENKPELIKPLIEQMDKFISLCENNNYIHKMAKPSIQAITDLPTYISVLEKSAEINKQYPVHDLSPYLLDQLPNSVSAVKQGLDQKLFFVCKQQFYNNHLVVPSYSTLKKNKHIQSFSAQALAYLARKLTELNPIFIPFRLVPSSLEFFEIVNKVPITQLNNQEKILLANLFLECALQVRLISNVRDFIESAIRVKKVLGIDVYCKLLECSPSDTDYNLYLYHKIFNLLLILNNSTLALEILNEHLPNISELLESLEARFNSAINEIKAVDIVETFGKESELARQPIDEKELNLLRKEYFTVIEESKNLKNLPPVQLAKLAHEFGQQAENSIYSLKLVAAIRELVFHAFHVYPYHTQLLSFLSIIRPQENNKGRVAQIRTGEGKSLIVAMLAAYLCYQNRFVDIISSANYLAKRDQQKSADFFKLLNVTSAHICYENPERKHFDAQVLYGTSHDFQFSILRDQLFDYNHRQTTLNGVLIKRICDAVIVDELDSLFLDSASNAAILSLPTLHNFTWVYEPIYQYVQHNFYHHLNRKISDVKQILAALVNHDYKHEFKHITEQQITKWITSAESALIYQKDENYVIKEIESITTYQSQKQDQIVIVDNKNTGRLSGENCRWKNGLHQFIEAKHKLSISPENSTGAALCQPAFFAKYRNIYGLTGTIGEKQERKELTDIYSIGSFDVPPHFPSQRRKLPAQYSFTLEQYKANILYDIDCMILAKRPVLVLFNTIKETNEFSKYLTRYKVNHQILNDVQEQQEELIVNRAGRSCAVTIATNTAGRGTDIILTQESKSNGGLHVILTFFPPNLRVEEQGVGRAGRQGQPGSSRMILHKDDEYINFLVPSNLGKYLLSLDAQFVDLLNQLRSAHIQIVSQERLQHSRTFTIQYKIFSEFSRVLAYFRTEIKNMNTDLIVKMCSEIKTIPVNTASNHLSLFKNANQQGRILLSQQLKGQNVEWHSFIESIKKLSIELLLYAWGNFYTELCEMKVEQCKKSELDNNANQRYSHFFSSELKQYVDQPEKVVLQNVKEILQI